MEIWASTSMPIQQPSMLLIRKLVGLAGTNSSTHPLLISFFKWLQRDISWWEGDRFAVFGLENFINTVWKIWEVHMTIHEKYTSKDISVDEEDICDFEGLLGSGLGWMITCQVSVGGQVATNWTNIFSD